MRRSAKAGLALLALLGTPAAAAGPQHIMSLNVCTDELLLDLVPASRIASLTFLSREKASLRLWPQAARIAVNHGMAEEVLTTHPDLILTEAYGQAALNHLLVKSGARLVLVPPAENFAQIRQVTRQVAKAVGEEAHGEALIARMDRELRTLQAQRPRHRLTVVGWGGGGYVPGAGGLFDAIVTAAGGRNLVRAALGTYDVESLIAANPDVLLYNDSYGGTASLRADQDRHPALLARYAGRRFFYAGLYGCGVPQSVQVAKEVQKDLRMVSP